MGEVVRIESPNALVKQIKACVERADKAESDADYWKHKAGVQLIKLKERCEHGDWLPHLKTIGIAQQRASELMQSGHNIDWAKIERARQREKQKKAKAKARAQAKTKAQGIAGAVGKLPVATGNLVQAVADDEDQTIEERWQNSLGNLAGDVLAIQPYWDKHFAGWQKFKIPSHIKKLVRDAAAEFASLAALIKNGD